MPVSPLCAQRVLKLLCMFKIPCSPFVKWRPNGWWHGNIQTKHHSSRIVKMMIVTTLNGKQRKRKSITRNWWSTTGKGMKLGNKKKNKHAKEWHRERSRKTKQQQIPKQPHSISSSHYCRSHTHWAIGVNKLVGALNPVNHRGLQQGCWAIGVNKLVGALSPVNHRGLQQGCWAIGPSIQKRMHVQPPDWTDSWPTANSLKLIF